MFIQAKSVSSNYTDPILHIENLHIAVTHAKGAVSNPIVRGIDIKLHAGEMLALVGESGSGKSVTANAVLGLLPKPLSVIRGNIWFKDKSLTALTAKEKRALCSCQIACLFQNYQGSFSPFITIGNQLIEIIKSHHALSKQQAKHLAIEWLEKVKLPADRVFSSYSFQLSGGQLQRASLAAALMLKPSLIIADEPTTALDVLTGEYILNLLSELRQETGCAVLFISHDLSHVFRRADRLAIMYGGQIVEKGTSEQIRANPEHPYTQLLLQARPSIKGQVQDRLAAIPGEPGLISAQGCPFQFRCREASERCASIPVMTTLTPGHEVACHERYKRGDNHEQPTAASDSDLQVVYT